MFLYDKFRSDDAGSFRIVLSLILEHRQFVIKYKKAL